MNCKYIRGREILGWCWPSRCKAGVPAFDEDQLAECTNIYVQGGMYYVTLVSGEELGALGITVNDITYDNIIDSLTS